MILLNHKEDYGLKMKEDIIIGLQKRKRRTAKKALK